MLSEGAELYGLPLEEFTRERDSTVRRLREAGRPEDAATVAALRKPTIDVWALNQVARRRPGQVEALVAAHQALREASDGEAFRQASSERHRAFEALLEAAAGVLEEAGHARAGGVMDRMSRSLLAAGSDPDVEEALQAGVLTRAAEGSAQWPGMSLPTAPPPSGDRDESTRQEEVEKTEMRARELSERAARLREAAHHARRALEQARAEAEAAERSAREAEREAREADDAARKARRRR